MKLKFILLAGMALSIGNSLFSMVPKKLNVEHFTNTYCSVCANRNPGFKSNLNQQSDYTLLTFHPSSPYQACTINKSNKRGNDSRTRHYGVYGSTPRLVINGSVINVNSDYSKPALFTPFVGDSSAFSMKLYQYKTNNNLLRYRVVITKEDIYTEMEAQLYLAVAEDSFKFNAPNGETLHRNVFRIALTDSNGNKISLPVNIGDSVVYNFETGTNGFNAANLIGVAILQDKNGELLQSQQNQKTDSYQALGLNTVDRFNFDIYPNPSNSYIQLKDAYYTNEMFYSIYNLVGKPLLEGKLEDKIDVSDLTVGLYWIKISEGDRSAYRSLSIQR